MNLRRRRQVSATVVFFLFSFAGVQACGPDFEPDTFVRVKMPDDLQKFAQGRLGILETGYDSNELAVAYRYLNGGKLSAQEHAAYLPAPQPVEDLSKMTAQQVEAARNADEAAQPVNKWKAARSAYLPAAGAQASAPPGLPVNEDYYNPGEVVCPDPAFLMASLTVNQRATTWGKQSPWLADWIHAQDAVFSDCDGKSKASPASAPAGAPALLRADRAYQAAAAAFYAGDFDAARAGFESVATDAGSPWRPWGHYLAARAMVRKAFSMGKKADQDSQQVANFDLKTMQTAQKMLEALAAKPDPGLPRGAAENELNFVRMRTEPDKRAAEICAALAGPAPDANFKQDLDDLNYILYNHVELKNPPPLLAWIAAIRGKDADAPLAEWKKTHALPWLVAAMMKADASGAGSGELLQASAAIQPGAPAYETAAFHRARLLTGLKRTDEARALVDSLLEGKAHELADSDKNAFLGERMALARTFDEFLKYAPRTVLEANSEGAFAIGNRLGPCKDDSNVASCAVKDHSLEFDSDAATILTLQTPMSMLVKAAQSQNLPASLRQETAMAAWTRAVLLDDAADAAQLAPLLPESVRKTAGTGLGFPAVLALLRNPGLRPVVEPGFSRLATYNSLDEFRDNWWCNGWESQQGDQDGAEGAAPQPAAFFSTEEKAAGSAESKRILDLPCAPVWMGQRVIDYAKSHPADPDVPEALALTVRTTHFACLAWGKSDQTAAGKDNSAMSKAAFQLLHAQYPHSPWTAKTKYYY